MECLPESGSEPNISVRNNGYLEPMASNDLPDINIDQLFSRRNLPRRQKVGTLGQSIHNDPYNIKTLCRLWQLGDKIHGNILPFPYGNLQRLQLAIRTWMLSLDHPAGRASLDVPIYLSLHTQPPVTLSQIPINLGSSQVYRK